MNDAGKGPGARRLVAPSPKIRALAPLAVAVVAAAALFAGLARGIPKVYDLPDHLGYAVQVLQAFEHGDFYPRWLAELNDGFGEATFVFYPPILHFTSAFLAWLLGGDVLAGLYVTLFLFAVVGGLGIFRFVGRVFGPLAGSAASFAFVLVPYRVFEMYSSGLYSAFAAGCIAPWALLALARLAESDESTSAESLRRVCFWALAFAAIVLTNMPSAVLWAYLVAIWITVDLVATRRWRLAARVAAGGVWGSLMAAVYLLPAVIEMRAVDVPMETVYSSNFIFQAAGSWMKPGLRSVFDRMALFPLLALVLSLAVFAMAREWGQLQDPRERIFARMVAAVGLVSLFLSTPVSLWAWRWLPQLKRVDMPWRLLEPLGLATAGATGAAVWLLVRARRRDLVRLLVLSFLACLALVTLVFDVAESDANGHVPAKVARSSIPSFARKEVFFLLKGARRAAEMRDDPPVSCSRPCRVRILDWSPTRREFEVASAEPIQVALRTYFFPGWRAARGGAKSESIAARAEPGTGRILVDVPGGETRLRVWFGTTPPRVAGGVLSILALAVWAGVLRRTRRRGSISDLI